ncbi:hypothetical protein IGI04_003332 [Brassica rapa subsp. trilocularis]|uniref:NYN domain-containing protein n=1 Tax=Brassica rapa subsp. trilocularis TaxID=1813537 RepID=A0ABQ7P050_BRACM|nr:hypothetical protein IGI04_003332 [Brassica rapa subsp. trilocularis]
MSYLPPVLPSAHYANTFPAAHTGVFWDLNDFPIPCLDPHVVYENIKSTLLNKGYSGPVSIWLYANHESQIQKDYKEDYESAGFRFCFEPADTRDYRMSVDMLICALDHPSSNLMVLAEDFKEEDAVCNIYLLHHRRQNIFLAYQQQVEPSLCTESPRWLYESVLQAVDQQGGQHVDKKNKTTIRIINTPMPTLDVPGSFVRSRVHTTHAIWDAVDSAALQDLEPVISAANIDAFFMLRGLPPPNFTKVFADEDALPEHLITEYLGSSLHVDIIPKGNMRVRIQKIAKFILFNALTHRSKPTTLLVLSEDILEDPLFMTVYEAVKSKGFTLIFQPPKSILASELYLDPRLGSCLFQCSLNTCLLPPVWTLANYVDIFREEDAVDNIYLLHHRKQNFFLAYKQQVKPRLHSTENPGWLYESLLQDKKPKTTKVSCKTKSRRPQISSDFSIAL